MSPVKKTQTKPALDKMRVFLLHEETEEAETRRRFGLPVDMTYISRIKEYFQKKSYLHSAFELDDSFSEPDAINSSKGKATSHRKTATSTKRSNSCSPTRITKIYSISDTIATPKRNRIANPKQKKSASSESSSFRKALEHRPEYGHLVLRRLSNIDTALKVLSGEITSLGHGAKQITDKLDSIASKLAQTDQDIQSLTASTQNLREDMNKLAQIIPQYQSNLGLNSPVFYELSMDDEGYSSN